MIARIPRIIRGPKDADAEIREELATHVAMWTEHYLARGVPRADAERRALERVGQLDVAVEALSVSARHREARMNRREWWRTLRSDVMFALRQMRRQPTFTVVVLLTFALGIGANTAMYSVVHGVLLRPLPFRDPERLAAIWTGRAISNAELGYLQRNATTLREVAAFSPGWGVAMTGAGEPRQLDAARISVNFFQTLGARPALGRTFTDLESTPGNWDVVILSHALWTTQFGADSAVIGRVVDMDGQPTHIVGVMPPDFEAMQSGVDAWFPLQIDPSSPFYTGQTALAIGRLAPGASFASATTELAALAPKMRVAFNYADDYARGATVVSLHDSLTGATRRMLLVLLGAVAALVLIAITNVGNLMLAHTAARHRELAIRRALGAGRARIVRQLLVQSLVLATFGGLLGVAAGAFGMRGVKAVLPSTLPMLSSVSLHVGVLVVCAVVTIGAGVLFGIGPAAVASRVDPDGVLRVASGDASGRAGALLRRTLVVVEIALAVVLIAGAGLMAETLWRLQRVNAGFDPRNVLTFRIQPTSRQVGSAEQTTAYFTELTRRIAAIPGVSRVGAVQHLPLSGFNWKGALSIESRPIPPSRARPAVVWRSVVGDYFGTMRIPLLRGRLFDATDGGNAPPVILVSASMAAHYWPNANPIGERIRVGSSTRSEWATIVGVVGDVRSASPDAPGVEEVYRPNAQQNLKFMHFVVRTTIDPGSIVPSVRAAVHAFDPTVPVAEVQSLDAIFATSIGARRTVALLLATFAILGTMLGAVGVYGVVAYSVGQRTRELGIRSALGAVERRITWMVVREGLRLSSVGVALGIASALVAGRALQALVFGVRTTDPLVLASVAMAALIVAAAASYAPARRAARIDPLTALRGE
jgi:predicted permease